MNIEKLVQQIKNFYTTEYNESHKMRIKNNQGELTKYEALKEKLKEVIHIAIKI